ncbi:MAG TPA: helix-turn-helix transcriptional regulator [Candidatus Baltobacteraceae bacterium]
MPYSKDYRPALVTLGKRFIAARNAAKRSQADVARALRMSQSSLSHIERGADTSLSTFVDLARELNLEPTLVPKALARIVSDLAASHRDARNDG